MTDSLEREVADEVYLRRKVAFLYGLVFEEIRAQVFLVVIREDCGDDGVWRLSDSA